MTWLQGPRSFLILHSGDSLTPDPLQLTTPFTCCRVRGRTPFHRLTRLTSWYDGAPCWVKPPFSGQWNQDTGSLQIMPLLIEAAGWIHNCAVQYYNLSSDLSDVGWLDSIRTQNVLQKQLKIMFLIVFYRRAPPFLWKTFISSKEWWSSCCMNLDVSGTVVVQANSAYTCKHLIITK